MEDFIQRGALIAQEAVAKDTANDVEGAIVQYRTAIRYFETGERRAAARPAPSEASSVSAVGRGRPLCASSPTPKAAQVSSTRRASLVRMPSPPRSRTMSRCAKRAAPQGAVAPLTERLCARRRARSEYGRRVEELEKKKGKKVVKAHAGGGSSSGDKAKKKDGGGGGDDDEKVAEPAMCLDSPAGGRDGPLFPFSLSRAGPAGGIAAIGNFV